MNKESISKTLYQLERLVESWSDDTLIEMYRSVKEDSEAGQESSVMGLTYLARELSRRGLERN